MTRYSVQPRGQIFVKFHGFLSFAKNMDKNIGENIAKILSGKYSPKRLDHGKKSATYTFKTSPKRVIQKTAEATGDLIGNKITDKITKVLKSSQQNNSVTKQMSMIKKCLKRDIYLKTKDKKLLIN